METLGWVGNFLLASCGLPQMIKSIKDGHSNGLSWLFILAWFLGEVCVLLYILPMQNLPLLVNYSINLVFVTVILIYKFNGQCSVHLKVITLDH